MSTDVDIDYAGTKDSGREVFAIGPVYEDKPSATQACNTCGGDEFHVGVSRYFTAIKCTKCGHESCIHEG